MNVVIDIIKGMILGIGIVIPGVSGGALAVVFNIYHKLLRAIGHFFEDIWANLKFLSPIGIGVISGIFVFSALIQYLLEHYLSPTNFFFIGLIIGGIPSIFKQAKFKKIKLSYILTYVLTVGIVFLISSVQKGTTEIVLSTLTIKSACLLFIGGVLGAGTMVIPGASGAVVLILLGLYETVLTAVVDFNLLLMIPFGVGALVGLVILSRIVESLFATFPYVMYSAILGLLTGSIIVLYPGLKFDGMGLISIASLFLGMTVALVLENIDKG